MTQPFRYYEEPDPTNLEALEAELDTRAADDCDANRKERQ